MPTLRHIHPRISVGSLDHCRPGSSDCAVIHACKSPCHQRAIGYSGSLPKAHEHYLARADEHDLWLNLVDPHIPLFQIDSFTHFLAFAAPRHDSGQSLLLHCNLGESRSPTLALLLLARHLHSLPAHSYAEARAAYESLDPAYRPGTGIAQFFTENWHALTCSCSHCAGRESD